MSELPMYPLGMKVPGYGKISAVRKFADATEREYLLFGKGVVSWLSHSDIKAMLEANNVQA